MTVGWISWECPIESLKFKTQALGKILEKVLPSKKLQPDKQYICFDSHLNKEEEKAYDEIWICDCKTQEIIWIISIRDKKVYHCKNEFEEPVICGKSMSEIVKWFINGKLKGYEKPFN
jgi:hypothetical protein